MCLNPCPRLLGKISVLGFLPPGKYIGAQRSRFLGSIELDAIRKLPAALAAPTQQERESSGFHYEKLLAPT